MSVGLKIVNRELNIRDRTDMPSFSLVQSVTTTSAAGARDGVAVPGTPRVREIRERASSVMTGLDVCVRVPGPVCGDE